MNASLGRVSTKPPTCPERTREVPVVERPTSDGGMRVAGKISMTTMYSVLTNVCTHGTRRRQSYNIHLRMCCGASDDDSGGGPTSKDVATVGKLHPIHLSLEVDHRTHCHSLGRTAITAQENTPQEGPLRSELYGNHSSTLRKFVQVPLMMKGVAIVFNSS